MKLQHYADWAQKEVTKLSPEAWVRSWAKQWRKTLSAIRKPGPYEHLSIIVARWEFLGGLYTGSADTGVEDARAWTIRFMSPIRSGYARIHNLSGQPKTQRSRSEFFAAYRNRVLHGYTPVAIYRSTKGVTGWWIPSRPHLEKTIRGSLRISSASLQVDFIKALERFALYLGTNRYNSRFRGKPQELWRRSFWMRFQPLNYSRDKWRTEGKDRGLFI
jgi:hypothetical protein